MSLDPTEMDDRAALAAEYALGLLDGEALAEVRSLALNDPVFAADVAAWSRRLAPLLDDVDEIAPPSAAWAAIERRTSDRRTGERRSGPARPANDNLVVLRRRLNMWRGATAATAALAAALALAVFTPSAIPPLSPVSIPAPSPAPALTPSRSPPMVAMLGDGKQAPKLMASWDPDGRQLVLAATAPMPTDKKHGHELWVIPADGKPRSLGTMPAGTRMHMTIPAALSVELAEGASLAVSVEPLGGSPTGLPTGAVIASGALQRA